MSKIEQDMPIDDAKVEEIQLLSAKEIREVSGGAGHGKAIINPMVQRIGTTRLVNKQPFFS